MRRVAVPRFGGIDMATAFVDALTSQRASATSPDGIGLFPAGGGPDPTHLDPALAAALDSRPLRSRIDARDQ